MESSGDICWPMCARDKNMIGLLNMTAEGCDANGGGCGPEFTPGTGDNRYGWCTLLGNVTLGQYRLYGDNFVPEAYGQSPMVWWTCGRTSSAAGGDSGDVNPNCTILDNPNYGATHFDSLPWAMVSLFQAITLEGWVDQMYDLMDGCSVWVFVYYVALVMIGAIVILNLFLAVLCNSLLESNDDVEETEDDVPDAEGGEKGVLKALRAMKHSNVIRQRCLELVRWKYFDVFIQSCIVINTVVMAAKFSPRPTAQLAQSIVYSSQWDYMPAALLPRSWSSSNALPHGHLRLRVRRSSSSALGPRRLPQMDSLERLRPGGGHRLDRRRSGMDLARAASRARPSPSLPPACRCSAPCASSACFKLVDASGEPAHHPRHPASKSVDAGLVPAQA